MYSESKVSEQNSFLFKCFTVFKKAKSLMKLGLVWPGATVFSPTSSQTTSLLDLSLSAFPSSYVDRLVVPGTINPAASHLAVRCARGVTPPSGLTFVLTESAPANSPAPTHRRVADSSPGWTRYPFPTVRYEKPFRHRIEPSGHFIPSHTTI